MQILKTIKIYQKKYINKQNILDKKKSQKFNEGDEKTELNKINNNPNDVKLFWQLLRFSYVF